MTERFNFTDAVNVLDTARETIEDINRDEFVPQEFTSSAPKPETSKNSNKKKKLPDKVKIDLKNEKIIMETIEEEKEPELDPLIHPDFFGGGTEEERQRRWIKKLQFYGQKIMEQRGLDKLTLR